MPQQPLPFEIDYGPLPGSEDWRIRRPLPPPPPLWRRPQQQAPPPPPPQQAPPGADAALAPPPPVGTPAPAPIPGVMEHEETLLQGPPPYKPTPLWRQIVGYGTGMIPALASQGIPQRLIVGDENIRNQQGYAAQVARTKALGAIGVGRAERALESGKAATDRYRAETGRGTMQTGQREQQLDEQMARPIDPDTGSRAAPRITTLNPGQRAITEGLGGAAPTVTTSPDRPFRRYTPGGRGTAIDQLTGARVGEPFPPSSSAAGDVTEQQRARGQIEQRAAAALASLERNYQTRQDRLERSARDTFMSGWEPSDLAREKARYDQEYEVQRNQIMQDRETQYRVQFGTSPPPLPAPPAPGPPAPPAAPPVGAAPPPAPPQAAMTPEEELAAFEARRRRQP